jgi:hypothetical protein
MLHQAKTHEQEILAARQRQYSRSKRNQNDKRRAAAKDGAGQPQLENPDNAI